MARRKNKQTRKYKPRNEFRQNVSPNARAHIDYVFGETDTHYKSMGLTHNPDDKYNYYPLSKNPNPKDPKQSHLRLAVRSTNKKYFKEPKEDWQFAKEDKPVVRPEIKAYKKRTNRQPKNWYVKKKKSKKNK